MAITIEINEIRENEDDDTVFFTITVNDKSYEWHADIPKNAAPIEYLKARKEKIKALIQAKIERDGEFKSTHPKYVKAIAEIDAISNLEDAKEFLKKLVRYIGK